MIPGAESFVFSHPAVSSKRVSVLYATVSGSDNFRRQVIKSSLALGSAALGGCLGPTFRENTTAGSANTSNSEETTTNVSGSKTDYAVETVAEGLSHPWGLAFLPDGSKLLVTERTGELLILDLSTGSTSSVSGVPSVYSSGQGGLLDVTLGPAGEANRVYLTYSGIKENGTSSTHVARGRLDSDDQRLTAVEEIFVAEPFVSSNAHYGSRAVFGPEKKLYVTVGDRQFKNFGPEHVAQDLTNELGATLRLEPDGTVPADNPYVNDPDKRDAIFSYGHRNAQGMTVHPETGAIWQAEHGERDGDEINIIESGANYGWPIASEACHYGTNNAVGDSHHERAEITDPVHFWPCGSGGFPPSGMVFYTGSAFPDWQGDLFVGTLAGEYLGHFSVEGRSVSENNPILTDRGWRIRALAVSPTTGELFVAVDGPSAPIVKITPPT